MQKFTTSINIIKNDILSKNIKKVGYMSLFFDSVHVGHCYALLKLAEICDITIAIPIVNKSVQYPDAMQQAISISSLLPSDYTYFPIDALLYDTPDIRSSISQYTSGAEWETYLDQNSPKLPSYLIDKAYRGVFSAAPAVSVGFRDMELLSQVTGLELVSIRGNKDFQADLQISLRCGMDQMYIPETTIRASNLIRKQDRVFCNSWRDSNNFLPRRISKTYSIGKGIDPNQFPKTVTSLDDFWDILNPLKVANHDYFLLAMKDKEKVLWREATVEDYNSKQAFLVISTVDATSPYYPHDFMWLNFEKTDGFVYNPKVLPSEDLSPYSFTSNKFTDKVDRLVEGMTDNQEIMTKMLDYFKTLRS